MKFFLFLFVFSFSLFGTPTINLTATYNASINKSSPDKFISNMGSSSDKAFHNASSASSASAALTNLANAFNLSTTALNKYQGQIMNLQNRCMSYPASSKQSKICDTNYQNAYNKVVVMTSLVLKLQKLYQTDSDIFSSKYPNFSSPSSPSPSFSLPDSSTPTTGSKNNFGGINTPAPANGIPDNGCIIYNGIQTCFPSSPTYTTSGGGTSGGGTSGGGTSGGGTSGGGTSGVGSGIVPAINNASSLNHTDLSNIKNILLKHNGLKAPSSSVSTLVKSTFDNVNSDFSSISSQFENLKTLFSAKKSYTFPSYSHLDTPSINIFGKNISLNLSAFAKFEPLFYFVFTAMFLWIAIRLFFFGLSFHNKSS